MCDLNNELLRFLKAAKSLATMYFYALGSSLAVTTYLQHPNGEVKRNKLHLPHGKRLACCRRRTISLRNPQRITIVKRKDGVALSNVGGFVRNLAMMFLFHERKILLSVSFYRHRIEMQPNFHSLFFIFLFIFFFAVRKHEKDKF